MSEKIYACLLRLYPARFRETYGAEALQLFRDRARHERGFYRVLRLWLDLLGDFVVSLPREYRGAGRAFIADPAWQHSDARPSFHFLEGEAPHPAALVGGGVVSLLAVAVLSIPLGHAGNSRLRDIDSLPPRNEWSSPAPQADHAAIQDAAASRVKPDASQRHRLVQAAIANLKQHYFDPDIAQKMSDALIAHENRGDYERVNDGAALADLITGHLREVSHDAHLVLVYSQTPLPDRPPEPTPEEAARYRLAMQQENCTFERVEMLSHNIGYFKLNSFPDTSVCGVKARAAMASLNHSNALVFDLRDNRGGYPGMVALIAAYLFDHPEYLYNPRENTSRESWTQSPIPGNRLADKPVYVLTSGTTASGAEQFSYDLKMLKRATVVGETTRGSAHSGVFHRIDEHFGMGIAEARPINPFSNADWEGKGVEPDVKVKAADALSAAEGLAVKRVGRAAGN